MIAFTIPIKTVNESNGSHGHPAVIFRRREGVRLATLAAFMEAGLQSPPATPCTVRLTRISAGDLDSDGLRSALKTVRDAVASLVGVDDDRDGERVLAWHYRQEKCPPGEWAVRVEFLPYVNAVELLREVREHLIGRALCDTEPCATLDRVNTALEVLT